MADPPQISDSEWEVMKALWDHPVAPTAGEIVQRLQAQGNRWRPRTIKTLLSRLVQKGAVEATTDPAAARVYRYRPLVTRQACVRRESRSFLHRVFDGDVAPAVVHFLKASNLSPQEIDRLRAMLDEQAKGGKK